MVQKKLFEPSSKFWSQ